MEANEILENEEVLLYNNVIGKVIRKELENLTYEETTYNFEVEDNHNYYVGEECVLVHNDCSASIEADLGNKAEYAFIFTSVLFIHQRSVKFKTNIIILFFIYFNCIIIIVIIDCS